jgi:transposase InsO family protein
MNEDWDTHIWLSASEVARLEGIEERTVGYRCRQGVSGGYVWRLNENKEKEIRLSSLKSDTVKRYREEQLPDAKPLPRREDPVAFYNLRESSTNQKKKFCDNWTEALQHFCGFRGRKNLAWQIELWNRSHDFKVSLQRVYAVRKQYEESGCDRTFLLARERHVPKSSVREEWKKDFLDVYMSQPPKSVASCALYALGMARQRGDTRNGKPVSGDNFPKDASWNRLVKTLDRTTVQMARHGAKAHYDKDLGYVEKDYSKAQAGSCWVGDTRIFDVHVKVPGFDSPKRPYITMFVDLRTSLPMGWHVHHTPPSTENTLRALKDGISKRGIPEILYLDNGREYSNKNISGLTRRKRLDRTVNYKTDNPKMRESAAAVFNIDIQFAMPYNARTKVIEGDFGRIKESFDKKFKAFCGGNPVERPEQAKTLKDKDYVSLAEFTEYAAKFLTRIYPYLKTDSIRHEYECKQEAWEILSAQRLAPLKAASQTALDQLVTLTKTCRIGKNGASVSELGIRWYAEWMACRKHSEITVRYDPENLERAWGYEMNGRLIGKMEKTDCVDAMISLLSEEERGPSKAKLAENMARIKRERKVVKELARRDPIAERQMFDAMEFGLHGEIQREASAAKQADAPVAITKHDKDMAKLRERSKYGDPDLLDLLA